MSAVVEQEILIDEWRGLYKESWKGLIHDDAFAHPAKFSRALIRRIYDHVIEEGWANKGDSVVDPFGGVALGAFDAMCHGLNWYGRELEAKFVALGGQNIALWNERFSRMPNWGTARLLQGDSRHLASVLSEASCCVTSPPYANDTVNDRNGIDQSLIKKPGGHNSQSRTMANYGEASGQLGAMKEGDHSIAITSPPYNPPMSQDHNGTRGGQRGTTPSEKGAFVKYGTSEGQLEGMSMAGHDIAISSPPYPQPYTSGGGINVKGYGDGSDKVGDRTYQSKGGDRADGNLETLDAGGFDCAVSSPPYENAVSSGRDGIDFAKAGRPDKMLSEGYNKHYPIGAGASSDYAYNKENVENLGNHRGETFWSASRLILDQLHQVIVPGGHVVFVVKAFVRDKKIVDFPGQWAQLCEAVGFKLLHDHHALLTEHYGTQCGFDEDKRLTVERKSFFRRLAESKGSPPIDHENVLCFERR